MQVLSGSLLLEQLNQDGVIPYRIVELQRRYWTGAAFAWESAVNISSYVKKVSNAKWKLDVRGFGEWKSPSFQVDLKNKRNFWSENEARGAWRTGLGTESTTYPELSRIRVRLGHVLPDGTLEDVYCFGGLISKPLADHEDQRTVTASCVGLDELLRRKSAEGLSTTATNEEIGAGSGTVFSTSNNGVGIIVAVKRGLTASGAGAATTLVPETDYSLANLNERSLGAEVTLVSALTAGNSCWVTYKYWYQNKELSWIVEQLLILAGLTNYTVDPTVFGTSVLNTLTRTSQADFAGGSTLTNIDTAEVADSFKKKWMTLEAWADGNFTNPQWSASGDGSHTGWTVSAGTLTAATPTNSRLNTLGSSSLGIGTKNWGTWDIAIYPTSGTGKFYYESTSSGGIRSGSRIEVSATDVKIITTSGAGVDTTRISVARAPGANDVYRISRDLNQNVVLYVDTGAGFSSIGTYSPASAISELVTRQMALEAAGACVFGAIYYAPVVYTTAAHETGDGVYTDATIDATADVATWGTVLLTYSPNGGTVLIETLSSSTSDFSGGLDPAGWVAVSGANAILSTVQRYLRVRVTLTAQATSTVPVWKSPVVSEFDVTYYTSTSTIPLVNMTGMTCLSAIQECAKYPGYEIGFTATESFFYRARTSATSVLTISKSTNLRREVSFSTGTDQVYTRVKATFGDYRVTIDSDVLGEAQPNALAKYGELEFSISSSLLPKDGANIADSAARSIYAYTSVPRKRAQVDMKVLVQYELGDRVTYQREHKHGRWVWGDPDRRYGSETDEDFAYHTQAEKDTWDIEMRIEGIELDTNPKQMRLKYDLVEIP